METVWRPCGDGVKAACIRKGAVVAQCEQACFPCVHHPVARSVQTSAARARRSRNGGETVSAMGLGTMTCAPILRSLLNNPRRRRTAPRGRGTRPSPGRSRRSAGSRTAGGPRASGGHPGTRPAVSTGSGSECPCGAVLSWKRRRRPSFTPSSLPAGARGDDADGLMRLSAFRKEPPGGRHPPGRVPRGLGGDGAAAG